MMHIALFMDFPDDELSGVGQHRGTFLRALSDYSRGGASRFSVFSEHLPKYLMDAATPSLAFIQVPHTPLAGRLSSRILKEMCRTPLFYHPYPEYLRIQRRAIYDARVLRPLLARHGVHVCNWDDYDQRCLWVDKPYVLTVYDLEHRYQPEFPDVSADGKWLFREQFYSRAIPQAFRVIVDSEAGKEDVLRFYNVREERVKVLPYLPVHTSAGSKPVGDRAVLERHGLQPGYLFYPAQFWSHKNHIVLLLALRELRDSHGISLQLALAGAEKDNVSYVRDMVGRLGLESQVLFLGFVPDSDMAALYRHALALVFASCFGPTNIPPLEAFEFGCPVIAAEVRGSQAQLGDAALLVNPTSAEQWAQAIFRLYRDPALRDVLIQRGRTRVSKSKPEEYVRGLVEIIDELQPIVRCWTEA